MKQLMLMTTVLGAGLFASLSPAYADEETEALKQELKALTARIAELEKREAAHKKEEAAAEKASAYQPSAGTPKKTAGGTKSIDQRLNIVERNQELAKEDAVAKAATTPKIDVGNGKGFTIASADKQYAFNVRAYAQVDYRDFFNKKNTGDTSTFLVRTARPIFDAKMTDYFNARMMWDFGQGNARLLDGYADFHPLPGNDIVNLRAGQQKAPIGIERIESEQDLLFTERGQTTNLVPFRDIGAALYGQLIPDQLEYTLGVMNGTPDLVVNTGDTDSSKDVVGRVFAYPLRWSGIPAISGLGVGVAGTYGRHQGSAATPSLTSGYVTPGQRVYFTYRTAGGATFADGNQWRFNPEMLYFKGPFGFIGEYVMDSQGLTRNGVNANIKNDAWLGDVSWVLTGEDASFDGVKPAHNFSPSNGQWGAFELAGRYSQLTVDGSAFPTFADITTSAKGAREFTGGVNWYFNPAVKLNVDYSFTTFNGGALVGDRPDEKVILARTQFRF